MHILIHELARACERLSEAKTNEAITLGERHAVLAEMAEHLAKWGSELPADDRTRLATSVSALINRWEASDYVLDQLIQIRDELKRQPAQVT